MRNRLREIVACLVIALLTVGGALVGAQAAHAESPLRLESYATDTTGSISESGARRIEEASQQLRRDTGVELYVVVVQSFTNPTGGFEWSNELVELNGFGESVVILYVGLSDQDFGLNAAQSLDISDAQLRRIENTEIAPKLNEGRIAEAGVAAAEELREALLGEDGGAAAPSGQDGQAGGSGQSASWRGTGGLSVLVFFLVVAALIAGVLLWIRLSRRKRVKQAREQLRRQLEEISGQAAQRLVHMDNQLAAAEQEVGFAEAQFGSKPVEPFRLAIGEARGKTQQAFALQNQILDHIPESDEQRIEWSRQIIRLTEEAQSRLAAENERFQRLREMERNAPRLLQEITERAERLSEAAKRAAASLASLRERYAAAALRPVDDAAAQAGRLLELAIAEAQSASGHLSAGRAGEAVVDISDAQQALAETEQAIAGIEHLRTQLEQAGHMIAAEIADMTPDIQRIRSGESTRSLGAEFVERAGRAATVAEQAIEAARQPGASERDPLPLLERLRQANRELDAAIGATHEERHRLETLRRRFERSVDSARSKIRQCGDYIASHRGLIGDGPRARLRHAEDLLQRAERRIVEDPESALRDADAAEQTAAGALAAAMDEADRNSMPRQGYGYASHGRGGSSGSTEAIIGGIIGGILSNAGRSHRSGGFGG
ncbi:MAG: TPM domain-containing protein, partial [Pseudoclavibacter sp.]|nr:TPM domain-containing protein [Pseudoclavibacter sp.]